MFHVSYFQTAVTNDFTVCQHNNTDATSTKAPRVRLSQMMKRALVRERMYREASRQPCLVAPSSVPLCPAT